MNQLAALEVMKRGYNVYLTGPAGTGKTYLLKEFVEYCEKKDISVAITASTGVAATHLDGISSKNRGMTIHSWSGIRANEKEKLTPQELSNIKKDFAIRKRVVKTDILIIDEVSMLKGNQLDLVNEVCKAIKGSPLPFGGLQIILCGDFFQLPPVNKGMDKTKFVFESQAWNEANLKVCYLDEIKRQDDPDLARILMAIRENNVGNEELKMLLKREDKKVEGVENPPKLFTHKKDAEELNKEELSKLPDPTHEYKMHKEGNDYLVGVLKRDCLAPPNLALKIGAQVMFVRNNFEEGYVNGTIGKVIGFHSDGMPIIKTIAGKRIIAYPQKWNIEENGKTLAEIKQIPLTLAWAITIHKSQGMTLDALEVNLGKAFEYGMGYVALSRSKTLKGINLLGLNEKALWVDPKIYIVDKFFREDSKKVSLELLDILEKEAEERKYKEANKKQKEQEKLETELIELKARYDNTVVPVKVYTPVFPKKRVEEKNIERRTFYQEPAPRMIETALNRLNGSKKSKSFFSKIRSLLAGR